MLELNKNHLGNCMDLIKEIPNEVIDMLLTDPPYDVDYDKKSTELEKLGKARSEQIERDQHYIEWNIDYNKLAKEFYRVLKKDSHYYIFCGSNQLHKWIPALLNAGFKNPQLLIWKKNFPTFDMTYGHRYQENKECILFTHKGWKKLNRRSTSVLNFASKHSHKYHSCEKPFNLLYHLIELSSNEGDIVLDTFSGSGNHLIASYRLKRRFMGIEMSVEYHEIIVKRLKFEMQQTHL